jgi:hypothetical protein
MTLEEAIKHAEAAAIENEKQAKRNREHGGWYYDNEAHACAICAAEHRQLADWLRELKERRKLPEIIYCGECELKIECCRNIRSGGRKDDDFCSCGIRSERRTE